MSWLWGMALGDDVIHPPPSDDLRLQQQHRPSQQDRKIPPAVVVVSDGYLLLGIHAHICASASLRWVRSLQGADISTSERRKRTWAGMPTISASQCVPGSGWGHLGIPAAPAQDTHSGAGACAHPTTEISPGAGATPGQTKNLSWHHTGTTPTPGSMCWEEAKFYII